MPPPLLTRQATTFLRPTLLNHDAVSFLNLVRSFSTTPTLHKRKRITLQRKRMLAWLKGPGKVFRLPRKGSTNYLSAYDKEGNLIRASEEATEGAELGARGQKEKDDDDRPLGEEQEAKGKKKEEDNTPPETLEDLQPFPLNPFFRSPSVLSERFREEIYKRVVEQGHTIRQVSQDLGVDMNRVGAIVRLQRVELDWLRDGKPLAISFSKRMLGMLPQTQFDPEMRQNPQHESINDLPVHQSTLTQLFHPAPESSHFTRRDAGRVFHRGLLPAEDRIPHPDMIESAREQNNGMAVSARQRAKKDRWVEEERQVQEREDIARKKREDHETVVKGKRWDFKFERVHADKAIGWRYGMPLADRKKGQVKIPRKVD